MRDEHQKRIGRLIAQLREQQGWSQRALAKWVHLDQSAVSRIEAGRRRVSADELQRLADAFHVSADALLLGLPGDVASAPEDVESSLGVMGMAPPSDTRDESEHADIGAFVRFSEPAVHEDAMRISFSPAPPPKVPAPTWLGKNAGPATRSIPSAPAPAARVDGLPAAVWAVVGDWFELRRLAGGSEPALAWSTGHSAEGKPARLAHPVIPTGPGAPAGDVLYDRVARFWRSELHVEPDDGPLPDLVPLLEDGFGAQVIVARVAAAATESGAASAGQRVAARPASERPVVAAFTADGVPFLFVNAARPVVLQRFALAHGFAHLVLGHGDVVDRRIEWNRNNPREAAANDFAEEFLAPVRAVERWYERHDVRSPEVETLLELGNAFGISAWAALYRSRAAGRLHPKQFAVLNGALRRQEWQLLPHQTFLGGLRDSLSHLSPAEVPPPEASGLPAVLRVPARMRAWALTGLRSGRLSLEDAAGLLRLEPRALADQLARLGLE
jgi:transcriptional regulator with XRE-family HTH domain